ncbi:hypothetical protein [uncultured Amnibacterium sp.]|uniref:hypothetical protein n=1 Tax=uncultured Amnibacterium sp. TaxID=1631851 RepID=UPI0035CB41F6
MSVAPTRFPDGSVTDPAECIICGLEGAPEEAVVFRDDDWACEVLPGFEVPGWYFLRLRRHALGWGELTRADLTGFGPTAQRLMLALEETFDAPARYLMTFGEAYPHFHAVVTVRGDDVPPESRSGAILALRASRVDRAAALAHVPDVRAALARIRALEPTD